MLASVESFWWICWRWKDPGLRRHTFPHQRTVSNLSAFTRASDSRATCGSRILSSKFSGQPKLDHEEPRSKTPRCETCCDNFQSGADRKRKGWSNTPQGQTWTRWFTHWQYSLTVLTSRESTFCRLWVQKIAFFTGGYADGEWSQGS